jgi:hypothetical protein
VRWPSRLVATASEDRLSVPTHTLFAAAAIAEQSAIYEYTRLDLYGRQPRRMGWPHAIYGFVQNKAQALLDVNFYNVCDDQEGKIMFERLITAIIMVVAAAIVASGLPLSSISGAGPGALGFFNLPPIF